MAVGIVGSTGTPFDSANPGIMSSGGSGYVNQSAALWTTTTAVGTTAVFTNTGFAYTTIQIQISANASVTGGTVFFESSIDNKNWTTVNVVTASTGASQQTFNFIGGFSQTFVFNASGCAFFRLRLSAAITGTGAQVNIGFSAQSVSIPPGPYSVNIIQQSLSSLATNLAFINAVTPVTVASGVLEVGIVGSTGASLDSTVGAGTAPTNQLVVGSIYGTSAPAPTTGQAMAQQCDYAGSLFVKPIRRSNTTSKATTIANSSAAATVLAAQAAGIFADISNLAITVIPVATTAITFTATLSDGTNSYIYDLSSGVSPATGTYPININFNPPLPATSAATAWTIALSVATVTVHITCVAVLQKAS